ncbi:uncharacterized protein At4g38062 isoform X1 [Capsicum annuum]|uniref:uncharacterized protein At4g38062 isoform X1 n=2 Tax=Capsicum annuum TaxID=4072 RepID=UPI001FB0D8AC|nr:uncharacterized protein At4g38062 isoform X1 [Capsicum annuum]XP_047256577.1 uncharacterized protein At4g38062 isoform X1 [Capsicum annuum]
MLLELFNHVNGWVLDSPKLVYLWRIRHGCGESAQLNGAIFDLGRSEEMDTTHEALDELRHNDDRLFEIEEVNRKLVDQLKWKKEQFSHLEEAQGKLRQQLKKYEDDYKGMALALDGATATNLDKDQQILSLKQEIEGLREAVSTSQKKSSEAEKSAKASKEPRHNDDMLSEIEEEKKKLADQLKWKKEQFGHLEEAHGKLRQQLKKYDDDYRGMTLALDGATATNLDQEQQIRILKQEIEGLREVVSTSQKKSSEAEKRAKASKESRHNDDMLCEIEEENKKLADQLKWKKEQFSHLEEAHGKLRQQLKKFEDDYRGMALALDGATAANLDQEQQIRTLKQEIEGLREVVSTSQKRSSEAEKRAKASKEPRHDDDMLFEIEEENKKLADQLKWKKEQFSHLEEAHGRLRQQHREEEKEWVKERSTLLDEISKLQMNLDSQLRISKDLESRLWMCNQALAHEESRRKLLEVQLAESNTSLNSVCAEYEESKSIIESLTSQRDKEIANLRDILGTRDALHKEMEYQFRRVEQENHELMTSVKELQEAKIQEAGEASSLSKLRNKLRGLEEVHRDCFGNLKAKEAEWASKLERLTEEIDLYKSSVQSKDTLITELREELATCESLTLQLTLQNEETSMMLLVLKSQFFELHQRIADDYASMELEKRDGVENISTLIKQLNTKNEALVRVQEDLEEQREKVALLSEKIESLNSEEQRQLPLQREVDTLKEMLKEASTSQSHLKEQVLHTKSDLEQVRDALDRANEELAESFGEGNELEFELQLWKSVAEKLKANLEENHQRRIQVEASLLAQAGLEFDLKQERESLEFKLAEKDRRVNELQQQLFDLKEELKRREQTALLSENIEDKNISRDLHKEEYLEQEWVRKELEGAILAQVEAETKHKNEKESLHQLVEEKNHIIYDLQKEVEYLEQEWVRKELEGAILTQVEAETKHKNEKERLRQLVEEKDQRIYDLQKEVEYLEQEWVRKELEGAILTQVEAETKHKNEKESLRQLVEEKNHRIYDLQQLVSSLENEFESSTSSFSASLTEMQAEVDVFHKTWEKMRTAAILKDIEIQIRNLVIVELENDFYKLQKEVEHLEKRLSNSVRKRTDLEVEMEAKRSEIDALQFNLEKQVRSADIVIKELCGEKTKLLEDVRKLSSDKDKLLDTFVGLSERINRMSKEDMQLSDSLEKIVQNCDSSMSGTDLISDNEFFDPVKENHSRQHLSTPTKRLEAILDERSPLRSLNN